MSPGFHSYAYRHSGGYQFAVEFLRFLAVLQSALAAFASFGIHKRNLLETRVVVTTLHLVCIYSIRSLSVAWGIGSGFGGRPFTSIGAVSWQPGL